MTVSHIKVQICSRVIDAQSPIAIVIPSRSSSFDTKLRDGDISWHDFLAKVKHFRQELVLYVVCYLLIFVGDFCIALTFMS